MSFSTSSAFKRAARKLLSVYLYPLRRPRFFQQIKGIYFVDPAEHLYRTTRHLDRLNLEGEQVMIDVGAAFGTVAHYFSERYPDLRIYCVEPNPHLKLALEKEFSGNNKVVVKSLALGSSSGERYLHVTANQFSSSLNELNVQEIGGLEEQHQSWLQEVEKVKVKVSTLDKEFKDVTGVLLLKLDTQGTENEILKGGVELLSRTRFVLTEMNNHQLYHGACQYHEVDEFLRSQSFRLVDLIVTYHTDEEVKEYDALYENTILARSNQNI